MRTLQKAAAWFWCGIISSLFTVSLIFLLYLPDQEGFLGMIFFNLDFLMLWFLITMIVIIFGIVMNMVDFGLMGLLFEGVIIATAMASIIWLLMLQDVMPFNLLSPQFWGAFSQIVMIASVGYFILRVAFFGIDNIRSDADGYDGNWNGEW
jgi:hypothetical protein